MRYLSFLLAVSLNLVLLATPAFSDDRTVYEDNLTHEGDKIGRMKVSISEESLNTPRIQSKLVVDFYDLPKIIDSKMKSSRNMGSCSTRVYWSGNTKVKSRGETLQLSSRVRFELWACSKLFGNWIKTRVFRDTKTAVWSLFLDWKEEPVIVGQVDNLRNFPNWAEDLLSLRDRTELQIKIPRRCGACLCKNLEERFEPKLEGVDFSGVSQEVTMTTLITFNNLRIGNIAECLHPASR